MGRPRQVKPLALSAAVAWGVSLLLSLSAADAASGGTLLEPSVSSMVFTDWLARLTFVMGTLCAAAALLLFVLTSFHGGEAGPARTRPEQECDHYA